MTRNPGTCWVAVAALLGLLGVAGGAFGAHALKSRLTPDELVVFEVGVRYHMYHALALFAVAWVMSLGPSRLAAAAAWCMLLGVILFSGSLYLMVLLGWKWVGPITPVGGAALMCGWLLLAVRALRQPKAESPVP